MFQEMHLSEDEQGKLGWWFFRFNHPILHSLLKLRQPLSDARCLQPFPALSGRPSSVTNPPGPGGHHAPLPLITDPGEWDMLFGQHGLGRGGNVAAGGKAQPLLTACLQANS